MRRSLPRRRERTSLPMCTRNRSLISNSGPSKRRPESAVIRLAFEPGRPETPETVIDVVRHILALALEAQQWRGRP